MNPNPSPDNILSIKPNEIFVFGANEAGRHGRGAAKTALKWGAIYGQGEGHMGQTYGIPTKGYRLEILSLPDIRVHVGRFLAYAAAHPELTFLLTQIGCGLAGYEPKDIAPMFRDAPDNVRLPKAFVEVLK